MTIQQCCDVNILMLCGNFHGSCKRDSWSPTLLLQNIFFICSCECTVAWCTVWSGVMAEFWLISAPGEKTCQQTWERMNAATTHANNLSTNNKFTIPDLKVKRSLFYVLLWLKYVEGWSLCTVMYQAKPVCFWAGRNTGRACRSVRWACQTGLICGKVWLLFTSTEK